jgi:trimeric autotransporter adhesin
VQAGQPFSWSAVAGASEYCLTVGTAKAADALVNSGPLGPQETSFPVPNLPSGQQLWARIYSAVDGRWSHAEVRFTVASDQPEFLWPLDGATGVGADRPFAWSRVRWATNYWVTVGTTDGGSDVLNTGPLPASQSSFANLPTMPSGVTLYARLLTNDGSNWTYIEATFTA